MKNILLIEYGSHNISYDMGLNLEGNINKTGKLNVETIDLQYLWKKYSLKKINTIILEIVKNRKIDIVFIGLDYRIVLDTNTLFKLKRHTLLVCYIGDDEHYANTIYNTYCQFFDLILCANYFPYLKYTHMGLNANFFPSGYASADFEKIKKVKTKDVIFVGSTNHKVNRSRYLEYIDANKIDLGVYGSGSENGILDRYQMYNAFWSAKINLNFVGISEVNMFDQNFKSHLRFRQIKGRCQEIALSGGFILCEYVPGIEKLFMIDEEISIFKNENELLEKINYYLNNESKRKMMAKKANIRAQKDYLGEVIWENFSDTVIKLHGEKNYKNFVSIKYDDAFWHTFNSQTILRVLLFLINFKFKNAWLEISSYNLKYILNFRLLKVQLISASKDFLYQFSILRILIKRIKAKLKIT
jgi:hypothetical protein